MGQPVTVLKKPSASPDVARLETNRTLTGSGHLLYLADQPIEGDSLTDELARRLISHGGVEAIHMYSNVITIDMTPGASADLLVAVVEEMFVHYRPGVPVPRLEDFETEESPD